MPNTKPIKLNDALQARINELCTELGSATLQIEALQARVDIIKQQIRQINAMAPALEQQEKRVWKFIESTVSSKNSNEKA